MPEMLEVMRKIGLLLGLFFFAWRDYKTQMVKTNLLIAFSLYGIGMQLVTGDFSVERIGTGAAVGGVCLVISFLTAESIGRGDGLLFIGTGMYLEGMENLMLFCGTVVLAGGYSGICVLLKKKCRKDRIALIPFACMAYVLFLL